MSETESYELIDRHLAGVLSPEEEARLETLIRTSPGWATRYREAEEMSRLLRGALGPGGVPARRRMAMRAAMQEVVPDAPAAPRRPALIHRKWLVAACLLVAIAGAYLFLPGSGDEVVSTVYANEPLPLKDLARMASVAVVGEVVQREGMRGFRVDDVLYGSADGVEFALPTDLHPGQRIALFARPAADGTHEIVGDRRGIVHLDGVQRWSGARLHPGQSLARLKRAGEMRSMDVALDDLRSFLSSTDSLESRRGGLAFSGAVAARFLGRFEIRHIREDLLRLVEDMNKDPRARTSAGEALVDADPDGGCRELMRRMMQARPHLLRAESEDGQVVLSCLELIRAHGPKGLAADLRALAEKVDCLAIEGAAAAAAAAVTGAGPRTGDTMRGVLPQRLRKFGEEALVLSGCEGQKKGLLVVFRHAETIASLRLPVNLAVGQGTGVLVLPPRTKHVQAWIQSAGATGIVSTRDIRYLGIGRAAADALAAAKAHPPRVVYLMADLAGLAPDGLDRLKQRVGKDLRAHVFAGDAAAAAQSGGWRLHPTDGGPASWLADEGLLERVLTTD